jgi:hypothetical protein
MFQFASLVDTPISLINCPGIYHRNPGTRTTFGSKIMVQLYGNCFTETELGISVDVLALRFVSVAIPTECLSVT